MTTTPDLPHPLRPIWEDSEGRIVVLDQRVLPHRVELVHLDSAAAAAEAIQNMTVRGAPLIGATAAYGVYLATQQSDTFQEQVEAISQARPTAVNLQWAIDRMLRVLAEVSINDRPGIALSEARKIVEEDVQVCYQIGQHGLAIIKQLHQQHPDRPVNILTHCNAGLLACIEWGTATSPIYQAHQEGIPVHVWVDETRPRNQGANLTCWELGHNNVPHTLIADNTGGHLMQQGLVDMVITGTDRTTREGDVANKIGTYLKALAAADNHIPFYVGLPSSTIDWTRTSAEIPIEERSPEEVRTIQGLAGDELTQVTLCPAETPAKNFGFDITPARLVTGLITERGICEASEAGLLSLFPEQHG